MGDGAQQAGLECVALAHRLQVSGLLQKPLALDRQAEQPAGGLQHGQGGERAAGDQHAADPFPHRRWDVGGPDLPLLPLLDRQPGAGKGASRVTLS